MLFSDFNKITLINGFDTDKNNAMQNNYAWSMSELGEYLYVGTGRNILYNILLGITQIGQIPEIEIPEVIIPHPVDNKPEIWRYHKGYPKAGWTRVFKGLEGISGFRYMIRYTDPQNRTALYVGSFGTQKVKVYRSTDGETWEETNNINLVGTSTRAMIVHSNGKLYMSTVNEASADMTSYIFEYIPPTQEFPQGTWNRVTADSSSPGFDKDKNPRGQIVIMESFNGHIYAAGATVGGFELWRTTGSDPGVNGWKLVIDKGAGDALNIIPMTLGMFKDHLYVGAIMFPLLAENPASLSAFKPFDLVRIDKNDKWELVIGGQPVQATNPTTGTRGPALSGLPSGVGNPFNLYCWQLQEYGGEFYLGTFDWSVVLVKLLPTLPSTFLSMLGGEMLGNLITPIFNIIAQPLASLIEGLASPFNGFDLLKSQDGIHWIPITINGLGNPDNYGARILFKSTNGYLYLGTANPFDGCEVWESKL